MWSHTERDLSGADLMFYMGTYGNCGSNIGRGRGKGKAYKKAVCPRKSYLQKYQQAVGVVGSCTIPARAAWMVSHEIGHNLGMYHDHDQKHGGTGDDDTSTNACNRQGIMSYDQNITPKKWSDCSVNDFAAHYNSLKNNWCLPGKFFFI